MEGIFFKTTQSIAILSATDREERDLFDLDLKVIKEPLEGKHEVITSKIGCTPGCGNTGTGNSFCCTC